MKTGKGWKKLQTVIVMTVFTLLAAVGISKEAMAAQQSVTIDGKEINAGNPAITVGGAYFKYDVSKNCLTVGGNLTEKVDTSSNSNTLIEIRSADGLTVYFEKDTTIQTNRSRVMIIFGSKDVTISSGEQVTIAQESGANDAYVQTLGVVCSQVVLQNTDLTFNVKRTVPYSIESYSTGIDMAFSGLTFSGAHLLIDSSGSYYNLAISAWDGTGLNAGYEKACEHSQVTFEHCGLTNGNTWKYGTDRGCVTEAGSYTYATACEIENFQFDVTFNMNGLPMDAPEKQPVIKGEKVTQPSLTIPEGYRLEGWYTEAECQNPFDFSTAIVNNIVLYAKWSKDTKAESGDGKKAASDTKSTSVPAKVRMSVTGNSRKKTMLVKWKKVDSAGGYEVQYSTDKTFKKKVKTKHTSKLNITIRKLKKGKKYYVRVRACNQDKQGAWSKIKKVTIRPLRP